MLTSLVSQFRFPGQRPKTTQTTNYAGPGERSTYQEGHHVPVNTPCFYGGSMKCNSAFSTVCKLCASNFWIPSVFPLSAEVLTAAFTYTRKYWFLQQSSNKLISELPRSISGHWTKLKQQYISKKIKIKRLISGKNPSFCFPNFSLTFCIANAHMNTTHYSESALLHDSKIFSPIFLLTYKA